MKSVIVLLVYFSTLCYCKNVIVNIENGPVRGDVTVFYNKTLNIFKGIRYGKAPIGNLRFKSPEKVDNWTDIYNATTERNSCWQNGYLGMGARNMNEDCLFLNVWAPNNSSKPKSVMVWFYGGGYQMGSILDDLYDATPLATFHVVVVTVNYRLGPFGFLYGGTKEAPGNAGLYDQLLALKWVKKNIHAFGGNPNDVTIFGESAGSWSVSYHILSPLSKGLFKKAIMQSGSAFTDRSYMTKNDSLNFSKKFSHKLGCNDERNWIGCLKNLDPKSLLNYSSEVSTYEPLGFLPVLGEAFYSMKSTDAVKTGRFNSEVKLMAGVTSDEGSLFVINWLSKYNSSSEKFKENVIDGVFNEVKKWKPLISEEVVKKVVDFYLSKETNVNVIKNKVGHVFGDSGLVCPTYFMAKDMLLWSGDHKVYFYKLTYRSKGSVISFLCNQEWTGVCHADDLAFVFGMPYIYPDSFTQLDFQFSTLVMNLWTNFAKTGNPAIGISKDIHLPGVNLTHVNWPALKRASLDRVWTRVMDLNPKSFGTLLDEPYKDECDGIWKSILDL